MSAVNSTEPVKSVAGGGKKKKKSKKKANGTVAGGNQVTAVEDVNGARDEHDDEDEEDESVVASPIAVKTAVASQPATDRSPSEPSSPTKTAPAAEEPPSIPRNGARQADNASTSSDLDYVSTSDNTDTNTSARLDAMQQEREQLRTEVSQLRQQLEKLQTDHNEEVSGLKEELTQTQTEKNTADTQYRNLLGRVNTIRAQLGARLNADAEELEQARTRITALEGDLTETQDENTRLQESLSQLNSQIETQTSEIQSLRSRTTLSTENWAKERDEMLSKEAFLREEYEVAKQAMQDWEILATEERSRREAQEERAQELEERLETQKQAYDRIKGEAETQGTTVDGLQRALRDLQEERKKELRDLVEQSQTQLEELSKQAKEANDSAQELKQQLDMTQKELERAIPFEKEVKEKNLLIGKLRHEAVILNDHLTKALRFLKRGKPEDNVDRQLVTNHLMQFLALDRSDPKKFEVLLLIAALLGWDEQQKEQAGLLRQGFGTGTLRVPVSPFRRTPSTPSLGEFIPDSPSATKESLAELWSDFLAREAESGMSGSRRPSIAQSMRSGSFGGITSPISRSTPDLKRKESAGSPAPIQE